MKDLHIALPQVIVKDDPQATATLELYRQAIYILDAKVKELESRLAALEK